MKKKLGIALLLALAASLSLGHPLFAADSDGDGMPDDWENLYPCLDPYVNDALLDGDTDGLENIHEYYNDMNLDGNSSDPCDKTKPKKGAAGGGYFGDSDGDLMIGLPDLGQINLELNGRHPSYAKVFPNSPLVQDMDGDLEITTNDKSILSLILNLRQTDYVSGSPTELSLVEPLTPPTVAVGETVRIKVKLTKDGYRPRAGFGVVFDVVSGSATLFGGEGGPAAGYGPGSRWDLTALDGVAQMVVRADGPGPILVKVELPYDGEVHTRQVTLVPDVEIQAYLDTDGDGLPDDWELSYPACMQANTVDNLADYDSDTLNNETEYGLNSNPCNADTDGDGMPDGWENSYGCVDILVGDSLLDPDGDDYTNLQEYQNGYDPCVFTDLTPPVITIVEPQDGMTTIPTINIHITYSDVGLGADTATLMVYHNDVDITATLTVGDTSATGSVTGSFEGGNLIRAYIEDLAGLSAEDSALVLIESGLPPLIWFVTPQDGQTVWTNTPYIRIEYEDPGSVGVNPASLVVILDYTLNITARFDVYSGFAEWWPKKESSLSNGWHRLEARVEDYFGNISLSVIIDIFVSFYGNNPTIVVFTPDFTIGGDTVTITGVDFGNTVKVFFPGTLGSIAADSVWPNGSTEIVAKVPGSVISGEAWVQNLVGGGPSPATIDSNTIEFTYGLPYAYITNRGANNYNQVTIFDYHTETFPAPESIVLPEANASPYQADITPDGHWVLVANWSTARVTLINTLTNSIVKHFPLTCKSPAPTKPQTIAISPDGSRAFVGSDNKVVSVIELRELFGATVEDGNTLCNKALANHNPAVYNKSYPGGTSVFMSLEFSPEGRRALIASDGTGTNGKVLSLDSERYWRNVNNQEVMDNETYLDSTTFTLAENNANRNPSTVRFLPQRIESSPTNPWRAIVANMGKILLPVDFDEDSVVLEMPGLVHHAIIDVNISGLHPICYGAIGLAISPLGDRVFIGFNYSNNIGLVEGTTAGGFINAATAAPSACNINTPENCLPPWIREVAYTPYDDKVIAAIWGPDAAGSYLKILDTTLIDPLDSGTIPAAYYYSKDHTSLRGPEGIGVWPHFDRDGDKISDLIEAANHDNALFCRTTEYTYLDYLDPATPDIDCSEAMPLPTNPNKGILYSGIKLPGEGIGYRHYYGTDDLNEDNWGTLRLLQTIEAVGREWNQKYPMGPRITTMDMSLQNGGTFSPHGSHQTGRDMDVRYVLNNQSEGGLDFCDAPRCNATNPANYNQALSRELVNLFIKQWASLIFVDPGAGIPAGNGVVLDGDTCGEWDTTKQQCDGNRKHSNHFHVRIP